MRITAPLLIFEKNNPEKNKKIFTDLNGWLNANSPSLGQYKKAVIEAIQKFIAEDTCFISGNGYQETYETVNQVIRWLSIRDNDFLNQISDIIDHEDRAHWWFHRPSLFNRMINPVILEQKNLLALEIQNECNETSKAYFSVAFLSCVLASGISFSSSFNIGSNRLDVVSQKLGYFALFAGCTGLCIRVLGPTLMDEAPEFYGSLARVAKTINSNRVISTSERILTGTIFSITQLGESFANNLLQPAQATQVIEDQRSSHAR